MTSCQINPVEAVKGLNSTLPIFSLNLTVNIYNFIDLTKEILDSFKAFYVCFIMIPKIV